VLFPLTAASGPWPFPPGRDTRTTAKLITAIRRPPPRSSNDQDRFITAKLLRSIIWVSPVDALEIFPQNRRESACRCLTLLPRHLDPAQDVVLRSRRPWPKPNPLAFPDSFVVKKGSKIRFITSPFHATTGIRDGKTDKTFPARASGFGGGSIGIQRPPAGSRIVSGRRFGIQIASREFTQRLMTTCSTIPGSASIRKTASLRCGVPGLRALRAAVAASSTNRARRHSGPRASPG